MKVEVCVDCIEDALLAAEAGADRIELNAALGLGGLTPALTTTRWLVQHCQTKIVAMVRPHDRSFMYSDVEIELMLKDCLDLLDCGVQGIVAGGLSKQGLIDTKLVEQMVANCSKAHREFIFHRAFDEITDQFAATQTLLDLGVDRILTSGGQKTAWDGRFRLAELQQEFGNRIELLPGSGINSQNAQELAELTGVQQLHGSFKQTNSIKVSAQEIKALRLL